jgi:hypothetical protein
MKEDRIYREIVQKHNAAEALISLFFAIIDIISYLIILYIFGSGFKQKLFSHREKLSLLIILDALLRIINLYIASFIYSLLKEIFISLIVTLQFYLIIILLNEIFTDKNLENMLDSPDIKYPYYSCAVFFTFVIKIDNVRFLSLIQYVFAIIALLAYTYYINTKILLFLNNVAKENPNYLGRNYIPNLSSFIVIYFIIYYVLKIFGLLLENKLYYSYMEMGSDIFKEVGKYLSFALLITIYYLYNKYIKEEEYDFTDSTSQTTVKIMSSRN